MAISETIKGSDAVWLRIKGRYGFCVWYSRICAEKRR